MATIYIHKLEESDRLYGAILANDDGTGAAWGVYARHMQDGYKPGEVVKDEMFEKFSNPAIGVGYLHVGTYSNPSQIEIIEGAKPEQISALSTNKYVKL